MKFTFALVASSMTAFLALTAAAPLPDAVVDNVLSTTGTALGTVSAKVIPKVAKSAALDTFTGSPHFQVIPESHETAVTNVLEAVGGTLGQVAKTLPEPLTQAGIAAVDPTGNSVTDDLGLTSR